MGKLEKNFCLLFSLAHPKIQWIWGVILNLLFLLLLYSNDTSSGNLQIPEGSYENNIWKCSDVVSYTSPAFHFVETGEFLDHDGQPDHFRTVGYPFFIAIFYWFFGNQWLLPFHIFQAFVFAIIYPFITLITKILIPEVKRNFLILQFLILCISGTYFINTAYILTDTFFVVLFSGALLFGLKYYTTHQCADLFYYLILVALAALVRPTLALMPLLNIVMANFIKAKTRNVNSLIMFRAISISTVLFILINISTLRNFINYSFLSPSSVIGVNAFHYLTYKILLKENKTDVFTQYSEQIDRLRAIHDKDKLRKKFMYETVVSYPISTGKVLFKNSINVLFSNNLVSGVSNYFGFDWKKFSKACYAFKTNQFLYLLQVFLMILYACIWFLFFYWLISSLYSREHTPLILLLLLIMFMFLVPAILTGDGGARFRLPVESFLIMFSLFGLRKLCIHLNR